MSSDLEANKALARAAIAMWSSGDFSHALEIFAPDYVMHQHHHADGGGDLGLKAMKAFAHEFGTGLPDFHDTIDLQLAEDDLGGDALHVAGHPHRAVPGHGADGQAAELDRHGDRPGQGRSDRRELGQLGHAGHAAAAGEGEYGLSMTLLMPSQCSDGG